MGSVEAWQLPEAGLECLKLTLVHRRRSAQRSHKRLHLKLKLVHADQRLQRFKLVVRNVLDHAVETELPYGFRVAYDGPGLLSVSAIASGQSRPLAAFAVAAVAVFTADALPVAPAGEHAERSCRLYLADGLDQFGFVGRVTHDWVSDEAE